MEILFYSGEPALIANLEDKKIIVISDLHMGAPLISDLEVVKSMIETDCKRIQDILRNTKPDSLVVAGDVKELIGVPYSVIIKELIKDCFRKLSKLAKIELVIGNHDGELEKILDNTVTFHKKSIVIAKNDSKIVITHGHRKLDKEEVSDASVVISGHIHPGYKLEIGGSSLVLKAWFVSELKSDDFSFHWIALPAFSSLIEGIPVNSLDDDKLKGISPFKFDFEISSRKYYLLDLTPIE